MGLNIHEIFFSIQGESSTAGFPSLFIRCSGCNLNCGYCDTKRARTSGRMVSFERLMNIVKAHSGMNHVTITGGEPMLQKNAVEFMNRLIKENVDVQIETNGSISLKEVPSGVRKISDVKTPSSGECGSFLMDNICFLGRGDEIKFVISDRADYDFSVDFLKSNLLNSITTINLSPANGFLKPDILAGWILSDKINIRLNLQLHRYIWADDFDGLKIEI